MIPLFNLVLQVSLNPDSLNPTNPLGSGASMMATFVGDLFPMMIKIIAAIAVLTIAFWGIRYMYSNVPGMEKVSKERIWSVFLGLLLALTAYLILQIINPEILTSTNSFFK